MTVGFSAWAELAELAGVNWFKAFDKIMPEVGFRFEGRTA
jgi:hypothetical protein